MDAERWNRIWELFHQALERPAAERAGWLASQGAEASVAQEVRELLESHDRGGGVLATGAASLGPDRSTTIEAIPPRIGRYRVLRVIATGGMGAVLEAEQDHPRRRVALKVIASHFASPELLRRFELEMQVLANLRHPGIAQLHEAGTYESAFGEAPYFAMELVPDPCTITEFAAAQRLSIEERLELFVRVCRAVHFGHQQGVIHRDLKPANVLIDRASVPPQPKIIDFGVAKATRADLPGSSLRTTAGAIVGTLRYMSPEQCASGERGADARSDVYSLGVILYELLCGRPPYELPESSLSESLRTIREEPPTRPSEITRALAGDLETILLKALRKEPEERYESAAHLADDVDRFLAKRPITARAPSTWYVVRMYARRNRLLVGSALAITLATTAGLIATGVALAREASHASALALERNKAVEVNEVLRGILESADPIHALDQPDISVREAVDRIAARIERGEITLQPEILASVLLTLGNTYRSLGLYDRAAAELDEALRLFRTLELGDHAEVATAINSMGIVRYHQGDYPRARDMLEIAVGMRTRLFGARDRAVAESLNDLGLVLQAESKPESAQEMFEQAIRVERGAAPPIRRELPLYLANLASVSAELGDFDASEQTYREAIVQLRSLRGETDPAAAIMLNNLGEMLLRRGQSARAVEPLNAARDLAERIYGPAHPFVAVVHINLAAVAAALGRAEEARRLYEDAYRSLSKSLGVDHPRMALALNNLGQWFVSQGEAERARPMLERALEIRRARHGARSTPVATTLGNLGACLLALGELEEGVADLQSALEIRRSLQGDRHPDTIGALSDLAITLFDANRHAESAPLLQELLAAQRLLQPPSEQELSRTLMRLGVSLMETGNAASAEPLLRECLESRRRFMSADAWPLAFTEVVWGDCLARLGRGAEAIPSIERAMRIIRASAEIPPQRRTDAERRASGILIAVDRDGNRRADP